MTNWTRNPRRPGRGPLAASLVFHVFLLSAAWLAHRAADEPIEYVAYEMQIVSAADLEPLEDVALPDPDELVVETPDPEIPEVEPEETEPDPIPEIPEVVPIEEEDVEEEDVEEEEVEEEEEEVEEVQETVQREEVAETQEEEVVEETATADIAVRMEGLQRDFPAYYRQIITQIQACFRWDRGGNLTTVVRFRILRDGTVPGASIRRQRGSGNLSFDLAAVGAVECAGSGRLDPLPDDLPFDELPVEFTFSPEGSGRR